jgi:multiple sugar transport system ATP-binding protein
MNLLPAVTTDAAGGRTFKLGSLGIVLAGDRCPPLPPGQAVTLGIRPEHVGLVASGVAQAPFETELVQIERLGAESIVIGKCFGLEARLTARLAGGDDTFSIASKQTLFADLSQVHVFDAAGDRIN